MVGMPDVAVRESRDRIKSALCNSGFGYPNKTVTISLAPANVRKEGGGFALPVALGILGAMGVVPGLDRRILAGELSLDGGIHPIRGALSIALCARAEGIPNLVLPADNAAEAAVVEGVSVYALCHLAEVVAFLKAQDQFQPYVPVSVPVVVAEGRRRTSATRAAKRQQSAPWKLLPRAATTF
jgi:magnesium chelatase family protein